MLQALLKLKASALAFVRLTDERVAINYQTLEDELAEAFAGQGSRVGARRAAREAKAARVRGLLELRLGDSDFLRWAGGLGPSSGSWAGCWLRRAGVLEGVPVGAAGAAAMACLDSLKTGLLVGGWGGGWGTSSPPKQPPKQPTPGCGGCWSCGCRAAAGLLRQPVGGAQCTAGTPWGQGLCRCGWRPD